MSLLKYPQIGVGAIVIKNNKILLVKRKNPPAKGLWAIPGGRLEFGESLKEACRREVLEETGIQIKVGELFYSFEVIERNSNNEIVFHYVILDFSAEYISGNAMAGDDALDVGWFSPVQLNKIKINPYTKRLLKEKLKFY